MSEALLVSPSTDRSVSTDELRSRVLLYLVVLLVIRFGYHAWTAIVEVALSRPVSPDIDMTSVLIVTWSMTGGLVFALLFCRFARPSRLALVLVETVGTLLLAVGYLGLAANVPNYGPAFATLNISLLVVLRAALVPSSTWRTVVVGALAVCVLLVTAVAFAKRTPTSVMTWFVVLGSAFAAVSVVMSHVIYGLRRQVREAKRLGQYELKHKIGEGGMGVVYQATHVLLRRPTAIKLLPPDKAGEHTVARFEREVRQTSRLEHPNSVYIYDYGHTPDGQFYYAMEYLDGLDLQQLVDREGPLPEARAISVLRQASRALAEAHDMGLVHRDIKPANIMLCVRGGEPDTVKVLDFGLVKEVHGGDDNDVTMANAIVGTPHYIAPEVVRSAEGVSSAADVYALGAVAFFLLTGRPVFEASSVIEVCAKHLSDEPESPSAVRGTPIGDALEKLILRCLSKQPGERPANGGELVDALAGCSALDWSRADATDWWEAFDSVNETAPAVPMERSQLAIAIDQRA